MKKLMGIILIIALSLSLTILAGTEAKAAGDAWPEAPETDSGSVLMIEVNTGAVLYSKDASTQRYPASTTKIMTCLLALENCSLNETVTFSENAVTLEEGSSSIDAVAGEQMSLKDCLYGLMVASGNDCANAIAEHVAGSVEAFADMMNARAAEIGCTGTHFVNPHGLFDSDHYTTAEDLCKIAQVAFNNSAFCEIISHATYTIAATNMSEQRTIESTHSMIVPNSQYYNDTVVGGKTGNLPESGRCLVTLAKHSGMTVIAIFLFSPTYNGVFSDTQELLDYAFNGFSLNNISQYENRFSYTGENAKITLDATAQILMPSSLELSDLDSEIEFTYDMDMDEFTAASEAAGITSRDGRHLYAIINYYYDDTFLGHINVLLDDNLEVARAQFADITFVNVWYFIIAICSLIVIAIIISIIIRITRKKAAMRRRRRRRVYR